jgi:hypothetical protein
MKSTSENQSDKEEITKQGLVPVITEESGNRLKLNFYFSLQAAGSGRIPRSYTAIFDPYRDNEILVKFYYKKYTPLKHQPCFSSFISLLNIDGGVANPKMLFYIFKSKIQSQKNPWCFRVSYEMIK